MLEPQTRRLLLESFRPPDGHRLDWAVGTTYTLDLTALLTAPVAFAFAACEDRDGRPLLEPLALLKAVRQYADRVLLFCQAGKIRVPRRYQQLLAGLEGSVAEAFAPRGGSFHPKLWFLRYAGDGDAVTYRLLVLSRNMTFDRSWDTLLCLDGPLTERINAIKQNHPLGEFVEALPGMARRELAPAWANRLKQLAHEIRRVRFEVPEPFEELAFHPLGHGEKSRPPFPDRPNRMLVVSPFVGDGLLNELREGGVPLHLVSRPECLERLAPATLAGLEEVWVLDDTAEPETGEAEEPAEPEAASDGVAAGAPAATDAGDAIPLLGLHAKLYVADAGWDAHVWTGSANATTAAFGRNVEFLVELRGKKSKCGVDAVLGRPAAGGAKGKGPACLADLLQPYRPGEGPAGDADEEEFEWRVDELAKRLAAAAPVAACGPTDEPDVYSLTLRGTGPPPEPDPDVRLRARPISLPAAEARDVDPAADPWVRFEPVTVLGLTAFFAFEAASADGRYARSFVLNVPLENAPADRGERILRHLLSDRDRVLKFLLLLLSGADAGEFARLFEESRPGEAAAGVVGSLFGSTLFESLMRAIDREPERIDQVAAIVEDLRRSPEGRDLLPADFDAIWDPIRKVRLRQLAKSGRATARGGDPARE